MCVVFMSEDTFYFYYRPHLMFFSHVPCLSTGHVCVVRVVSPGSLPGPVWAILEDRVREYSQTVQGHPLDRTGGNPGQDLKSPQDRSGVYSCPRQYRGYPLDRTWGHHPGQNIGVPPWIGQGVPSQIGPGDSRYAADDTPLAVTQEDCLVHFYFGYRYGLSVG